MDRSDDKIALVTGANSGIGKDVVRQLAVMARYRKVYLACRDRARADLALADLRRGAGAFPFEVVTLDVADLRSVRAVLTALQEPIDDLVMNAGGAGGKAPLSVTEAGVTAIFASNVLGHAALLDGLLASGRLLRTAVYVGSEAARGVPKLGMKRPEIQIGSIDEFASFCDGSYFGGRKPNGTLAYGQVKLVAALWVAAMARRHPGLRFLTVSPGNTSGTEVARDLPPPMRQLLRYVLTPFVLPLLGMVQPVEKGATRLVQALDDPCLRSGAFYASRADSLTGPLVDQSTIMPELDNHEYQDNAAAAVHRFAMP